MSLGELRQYWLDETDRSVLSGGSADPKDDEFKTSHFGTFGVRAESVAGPVGQAPIRLGQFGPSRIVLGSVGIAANP